MHTILVVDDEFAIVESLCEILDWEGFGVVRASNGLQALEIIEAEPPSLVLLDFMMPVMDGLQTLERIRANPNTAELPVLLMTAAPYALKGRPVIWQGLLKKPFEASAMIKQVRLLLGDDGEEAAG